MTQTIVRPRVFLDIQIGTAPAGRIVIELFNDKAPRTCENFRAICTASYTPPTSSTPLTYQYAPFHRVIDEFMIQGGDITSGNGTGGQSIYGTDFDDENIGWREIDMAGLVCMANRGKGTNNSQFFVTLAPCEHLNGKHTVFGHIVAGTDVVNKIAKLKVDKNDKPIEDVLIVRCGELERRKKPTRASEAVSRGDIQDKPNGSSDRGRKRAISSRSSSQSSSQSHERHKHRKQNRRNGSPKSPQVPRHRRSDVTHDGTRRGRTFTRSPSPSAFKHAGNRSPARRHHREQHRQRSPSSHSRPRETSPPKHLRRRHILSRSRSRSRSQHRRTGYEDRYNYRRDEDEVRREEQEQEGDRRRFEDVIEDNDAQVNQHRYRRFDNHRQSQDSYHHGNGNGRKNRIGNDADGDGDGDVDGLGGEVKFKGRGSMKYREKRR